MYLPYLVDIENEGRLSFFPIFSVAFQQGVVSSYYDDEYDEKTAVM